MRTKSIDYRKWVEFGSVGFHTGWPKCQSRWQCDRPARWTVCLWASCLKFRCGQNRTCRKAFWSHGAPLTDLLGVHPSTRFPKMSVESVHTWKAFPWNAAASDALQCRVWIWFRPAGGAQTTTLTLESLKLIANHRTSAMPLIPANRTQSSFSNTYSPSRPSHEVTDTDQPLCEQPLVSCLIELES